MVFAENLRCFSIMIAASICMVNAIKVLKNCDCGRGNAAEIDVRIIQGNEVQPNAYPWMVYMEYYGQRFCGGAIINDRYILTAAHCGYQISAEGVEVVLGAHDVTKNDGVRMRVKKIIMHHNYIRYEVHDDNDIALMKLKGIINFNYKVGPICLPNPDSNFVNAPAIISGWGTTENDTQSTVLLESRVRVLDDKLCSRSNMVGNKYKPGLNLCAYGYNTDTCQGDSGSPMFYESTDVAYKYEVIGIVSWGHGCAPPKIPGIYAKVTSYMDWIAKETSDANYCSV